MVDTTIAELQPDIGQRRVHWKKNPLPTFTADKPLLHQVLVNLLSNAIKYTGPRDPAEIEISSQEKEGEHIITIRDNGVGFDPAYAHKLFGVFQRLHEATEFEGTGIGLANVRRIITRHGGRVWAEGELDKGAAFHFTLPKP
jgi:chemotaxis family two-component system sensor kinase Cph1